MKVWLVVLGLALINTINAESECAGDHSRLQGKWYMTASGSDCSHFSKHKAHMKITPAEIRITENDKLTATIYISKKDGCHTFEMKFDKLDDGSYFHTSDWGEKKMEILSTDCENYLIVMAKIQKKGKEGTKTVLGIWTKQPELSMELKEKFLERSKSLGLASDQLYFPQEVACENKQ